MSPLVSPSPLQQEEAHNISPSCPNGPASNTERTPGEQFQKLLYFQLKLLIPLCIPFSTHILLEGMSPHPVRCLPENKVSPPQASVRYCSLPSPGGFQHLLHLLGAHKSHGTCFPRWVAQHHPDTRRYPQLVSFSPRGANGWPREPHSKMNLWLFLLLTISKQSSSPVSLTQVTHTLALFLGCSNPAEW